MKKTLSMALVSLYLTGCSEEPPIPEPEARPAKLMTVAIGDSDVVREFPGTVEADDEAVLAFRVAGEIVDIPVVAGQDVVTGNALAELDRDEYSLLLQKAKASYQLAKVQYDRAVKLKKTNVISAQDFDKAKSSLNEAQAGLDLAQSNFNYTTLKAPYTGTISLRMKEKNEFANAMEPVMHIQTKDVINVSFQLPERLISFFDQENDSTHSKPRIRFDAYPNQEFEADFKEVDTEADATSASYRITVSLPRPENVNVLPGMAAQVFTSITASSHNKLPETAVEASDAGTYVWRVADSGAVSRVQVELGEDNKLEAGLNNGDVIVVNGLSSLEEGMVVFPWVKERGL